MGYSDEEVSKELASLDEYIKISSEVLTAQKKLMEVFPKECKSLFLDYEEAMANLCDCQNKFYFQKGIEVSNANTIFSSRIVNE